MQRRPCWVEVSTSCFEENYRFLSRMAGSPARTQGIELLTIVKADAYGHGLHLCAPAAVRAGAQWLGVTSAEEGVAARELCPNAKILVISGPFCGQGEVILGHRLTPVVWDAWQMEQLEAAARQMGYSSGSVPVHLELDTGMNRQGVSADQLDSVLRRFGGESALRLDGVMTHLFAADESDGVITEEQFTQLGDFVKRIHEAGLRPTWLHVGNSAALLAGQAETALEDICTRFELRAMMRPGLALYGLAPQYAPEEPVHVEELRRSLQPVLAWKTEVVSVHQLAAGQTVGYNGTFVATEPMRLALLAVGYGDGLKRALSNRGAVLVRGQRAPIVGRISMDQTVVDVTDISGVVPQDEVVLLGRQGEERIAAEEHAAWADTVSWEILTSIAARVEKRSV
jgi:alanine racemase